MVTLAWLTVLNLLAASDRSSAGPRARRAPSEASSSSTRNWGSGPHRHHRDVPDNGHQHCGVLKTPTARRGPEPSSMTPNFSSQPRDDIALQSTKVTVTWRTNGSASGPAPMPLSRTELTRSSPDLLNARLWLGGFSWQPSESCFASEPAAGAILQARRSPLGGVIRRANLPATPR